MSHHLKGRPQRRLINGRRPAALAGGMASLALLAGLPGAALAAAPAAPSALKVTATGGSQIALSWTAPTGTVTKYAVYRGTSTTPVATVASGITKFVDTGRAALASESYRVSAFNDTAESAQSSAVTGTTVATEVISSCQPSLRAGHFRLESDLVANAPTACINLGNPSASSSSVNTSLDCQGHTITVSGGAPVALALAKLNGVLLVDCTVAGGNGGVPSIKLSTVSDALLRTVRIRDSGIVATQAHGMLFNGGSAYNGNVDVDGSTGVMIANSAFFNSRVKVASSPSAVIRDNLHSASSVVADNAASLQLRTSRFTGNAWGSGAIAVSNSAEAVVDGNTVTDAQLQVYRSTNAVISANKLSAIDPAKEVTVQLLIGRWQWRFDAGYTPDPMGVNDGVIVKGNTVTGTRGNVDDNILLVGPLKNASVTDNITSGSYDAGIETVNLITDSTFAYNTITDVAIAGIGAYHRTGWDRNLVVNNTVSQSPAVLSLSMLDDDLSPGATNPEGWDVFRGYPTGRTEFTIIKNRITGNVLLNADANPAQTSSRLSATVIRPERPNRTVSGNVFARNNFGSIARSPAFEPAPGKTVASMVDVVASTGNKCRQPVAGVDTVVPFACATP